MNHTFMNSDENRFGESLPPGNGKPWDDFF